jgi:ComF family protein
MSILPRTARRRRRAVRVLLVEAVADRETLLRAARHSLHLRSRPRHSVDGSDRRAPAYDRARAAVRYDDVARALVQRFKYSDRLDLAPMMGRWMARAGRELLADADALLPVPLHWRRLWSRRFNQAAALAGTISEIAKVPVLHGAIARVRATPQQVGLTKPQRADNVQGAFRVPQERKPDVAGKRLVLIDDVLTSGATADTCARALLGAGAAHVDVLVFARVVAPLRATI